MALKSGHPGLLAAVALPAAAVVHPGPLHTHGFVAGAMHPLGVVAAGFVLMLAALRAMGRVPGFGGARATGSSAPRILGEATAMAGVAPVLAG